MTYDDTHLALEVVAQDRPDAIQAAIRKARDQGFDPYLYDVGSTEPIEDPTSEDYGKTLFRFQMVGERIPENERRAWHGDR